MKKILSAVLALALVCCLAVTAMAVGYDLSVDKTIIEPGDTIVVTITNQETYSDTMAQIELTYD